MAKRASIRRKLARRFQVSQQFSRAWYVGDATRSDKLPPAEMSVGNAGLFNRDEQAAIYAASITAWACVKFRADAISNIDLVAQSDLDSQLEYSPARDFVENSRELLWLLSASLLVFGGAFLYKVRNEYGLPTAVTFISPMDITVQSDLVTGEPSRFLLTHSFQEIPQRDLIFLRLPTPLGTRYGNAPSDIIRYRAVAERNLGEWSRQFFANSARPDGLLIFEGMITPEQLERQREAWQQMRSPSNAWKTFVAGSTQGGKWTWQPITPPPTDLAMRDFLDQIRFDICAAYQVHPTLLGGSPSDPLGASNTYNDVWLNHIRHVALPMLRMILEGVNRQWLQRDFSDIGYELRVEIDLHKLNRLILATPERFSMASAAFGSGIMTLDEARQFIGLQPSPLGLQTDAARVLPFYQGGVLTLNEARAALGLDRLPTGDVVLVNGVPTPVVEIGKPVQQPLLAPPPVPTQLPLITESPAQDDEDSAGEERAPLSAEQIAELRSWHSAVLSHAIQQGDFNAPFKPVKLPQKLANWIAEQLRGYWNPDLIFERAERLEIEAPIEAADGSAFWRQLESDPSLNSLFADLFVESQRLSEDDLAQLDALVSDTPASELESALLAWFSEWLERHAPDYEQRFAKHYAGAFVSGVKAADEQLRSAVAKRDLTFTIDWNLVADEAVAYALNQSARLVKQINQTTLLQLQQAIADAVKEDASIARLRDAIAGVFAVQGYPLSQQLLNRAQLIAETELTRVYTEGAFERYKTAGVKRAIWQTAQDKDVCSTCRSRHNAVSDFQRGWRSALDGQYLTPPAHPRCRCFTIPVIEDVTNGV